MLAWDDGVFDELPLPLLELEFAPRPFLALSVYSLPSLWPARGLLAPGAARLRLFAVALLPPLPPPRALPRCCRGNMVPPWLGCLFGAAAATVVMRMGWRSKELKERSSNGSAKDNSCSSSL